VKISSNHKRFQLSAACAVALAAFAVACSGHADKKPELARRDSIRTESAGGQAMVVPGPEPGPAKVPVRVAPALPDTARPHLIAGRTKHDSIAFASTVAFGRRQLKKWPKSPTLLPGAILPNRRIVAFYGNPLSRRMGVLGEYAVDTMLAKLDGVVKQWERADPETPVQPALQLIAVVAQGSPGRDGMYRLRMDSSLIEKVYGWAKQRNALLFLDIQVGHSTMERELPRLMPFLSRPDVHLAMDAEFAMHHGNREGVVPGKLIGQFDASEINWVSERLRELVTAKKLPPKVLVIHRWTRKMISNADKITLDPRVQIVMDMDGWGPPWMKFESYRDYIDLEPVEYTGFKIFFHNDTKRHDPLLTPTEVLWLRPRPMYIQYQ
jgi:hypothetical protein